MRIDGLPDPRRVQLRKKLQSKPVQGKDAAPASDSVSISDKAKRASQTYRLAAIYRDLPDVRQSRLVEVRAKLENGEYSTREVAERTAERMLRSS